MKTMLGFLHEFSLRAMLYSINARYPAETDIELEEMVNSLNKSEMKPLGGGCLSLDIARLELPLREYRRDFKKTILVFEDKSKSKDPDSLI